jgi:peptide/nickel transport system permease protein
MRALVRFVAIPQNLLALAIVLGTVAVAAVAPRLAPPTDDIMVAPGFARVGSALDQTPRPPSADAPMGTISGQFSVFYTVVWGTRSALRFGLVVALGTSVLGVIVGALSGYLGGWPQRVTLPVIDAFLSFPAIAGLWVIRYAMFPPNVESITTPIQRLVTTLGLDPLMVALILFSWMPYARIANAGALRLREIDYVLAARALGAPPVQIVRRHVIPNLVAPIIVLAARDVGGSVMLAAAFTFIGVGGDLPWGSLLALGRDWVIGPGGSLTAYWWVYLPVTLALLLFGIGWNLLGDGLNDLIAGRQAQPLTVQPQYGPSRPT